MRARDQLLAGAGLALEQHGGLGRRDALEQAEDLAHARRLRPTSPTEPLRLAGQDLDALLEGLELDLHRARR